MKKIKEILLLSVAIIFASCEKTSMLPPEPEQVLPPHHVTIEDAKAEVLSLMGQLEQDPATRSGRSRQIEKVYTIGGENDKTKSNNPSDSIDVGSPLFYVFNFSNDEGFALASGDSRTQSVYCITESGHLDPNALPEEYGALLGWLANCETDYRILTEMPIRNSKGEWLTPEQYRTPELIAQIEKSGYGSSLSAETRADGVTYDPWGYWYMYPAMGTVIPVQWGQSFPYNLQAKIINGQRALSGCMAVACATIMAHWSWPNSYTHDNSDRTVFPFDWVNMKEYGWEGNSGYMASFAHNQISGLMLALNLTRNLNGTFGLSATSANHTNVARTFKNFGYTSGGGTGNYSEHMVQATLSQRPVMMFGFSYKNPYLFGSARGDRIGHAWVIDQLRTDRRSRATYFNGSLTGFEYQERKFLHINWGWNGNFNGYFYPNYLATDKAFEYDPGSGMGSENRYYQFTLETNTGIYR